MERGIEKTEDNGLAVHDLEGALDSSLHVRLDLVEGSLALFVGI